jgi:RHS repeat-associated protein
LAYVYDGDGQRVRKLIGENLRFIYDMHGQQIAEFDGANGNLKKEYIYGASGLVATVEPTAVNTNGTHYTTPDHLGSPRIVTNSSSSVVSRHDFMPFGEELIAGIGGRTSGMGYGIVDGLRQKFTQKERDNETGLDYFINRYCSSTQGRFTSADPFMGSGKTDDPQSWNRYAYVLNNPVRLVDRDGLDAQEPKKPTPVPQQPQPSPPQDEPKPVATQTGTLPAGACQQCSGQIVTTVIVDQMDDPGVRVRDVKGKDTLVAGVDLRVTFLDQNGDPIKGTVTESVTPSVIQSDQPTPLDSKGRGGDLVSNSVGSVPTTAAEADKAIATLNQDFTTKQTATYTVKPDNGPTATVTHERSLTNTVSGAPPLGGGRVRGYTFTMEKPKIKIY